MKEQNDSECLADFSARLSLYSGSLLCQMFLILYDALIFFDWESLRYPCLLNAAILPALVKGCESIPAAMAASDTSLL